MALGVKMESLDGLNYEAEFRENNYSPETVLNYPKPYSPRCKRRILFGQHKRLPGTFHTDVPSPIQPASVVRRNERERNRVRMVNNGFATLRQHVPNGAKNKKMSKVETLKSAVDYIKQLQELLIQSETTSVVKSENEKEDFDFERENRSNYDNPSVGRRCAERDANPTTGNNKYHYDNNCYDNFVPDNANVNQNYTNGQASFYSSNGSPTLSWPSSDTSSPGNHEHPEENILAFSSWFS